MSQTLDVVAIYCIVDDFIKTMINKKPSHAQKLSDSELITLALYAAHYTGGNHRKAMEQMLQAGYLSRPIDKSRLCRRLRYLRWLIGELFELIGALWMDGVAEKQYLIDSTPIAVCDNIRILRQKRWPQQCRGYQASFRRYYFGIKIQLITTHEGVPVHYLITYGCVHDNKAMQAMLFHLPAESRLIGDSAYTNRAFAQKLANAHHVCLQTPDKTNTLKRNSPELENEIAAKRKCIESVWSAIKSLFPKKIHAVTCEGFLLKVECFLLVFQLRKTTQLLLAT